MTPIGKKTCHTCRKPGLMTEYTLRRASPDMRAYHCRPCQRDQALKKRYGISSKDYERMLAAQGGVCAACGADDPTYGNATTHFAIDHDHRCCPGDTTCGKCIRALLCGPCNVSYGLFNEDAARILRFADYASAQLERLT